jgi:hypothetical protein
MKYINLKKLVIERADKLENGAAATGAWGDGGRRDH